MYILEEMVVRGLVAALATSIRLEPSCVSCPYDDLIQKHHLTKQKTQEFGGLFIVYICIARMQTNRC